MEQLSAVLSKLAQVLRRAVGAKSLKETVKAVVKGGGEPLIISVEEAIAAVSSGSSGSSGRYAALFVLLHSNGSVFGLAPALIVRLTAEAGASMGPTAAAAEAEGAAAWKKELSDVHASLVGLLSCGSQVLHTMVRRMRVDGGAGGQQQQQQLQSARDAAMAALRQLLEQPGMCAAMGSVMRWTGAAAGDGDRGGGGRGRGGGGAASQRQRQRRAAAMLVAGQVACAAAQWLLTCDELPGGGEPTRSALLPQLISPLCDAAAAAVMTGPLDASWMLAANGVVTSMASALAAAPSVQGRRRWDAVVATPSAARLLLTLVCKLAELAADPRPPAADPCTDMRTWTHDLLPQLARVLNFWVWDHTPGGGGGGGGGGSPADEAASAALQTVHALVQSLPVRAEHVEAMVGLIQAACTQRGCQSCSSCLSCIRRTTSRAQAAAAIAPTPCGEARSRSFSLVAQLLQHMSAGGVWEEAYAMAVSELGLCLEVANGGGGGSVPANLRDTQLEAVSILFTAAWQRRLLPTSASACGRLLRIVEATVREAFRHHLAQEPAAAAAGVGGATTILRRSMCLCVALMRNEPWAVCEDAGPFVSMAATLRNAARCFGMEVLPAEILGAVQQALQSLVAVAIRRTRVAPAVAVRCVLLSLLRQREPMPDRPSDQQQQQQQRSWRVMHSAAHLVPLLLRPPPAGVGCADVLTLAGLPAILEREVEEAEGRTAAAGWVDAAADAAAEAVADAAAGAGPSLQDAWCRLTAAQQQTLRGGTSCGGGGALGGSARGARPPLTWDSCLVAAAASLDSAESAACAEGVAVAGARARPLSRSFGCWNPGCTNLGGDTEGGLKTLRCGKCPARYCSPTCQADAWEAGHKQACLRQRQAPAA